VYNLLIETEEMMFRGIDDFIHVIDMSNTINGKPIYYLLNESDMIINDSLEIGFLGLVNCQNIMVENYSKSDDAMGILLAGTKNSTIRSSRFYNNVYNFYIINSSNNYICDCEINGGTFGFWIVYSPDNTLKNNLISDAYFNFGVEGKYVEEFLLDIDKSNTVNGKPIIYLTGVNNQIISDTDVGYLGLINCNSINISYSTFSGNIQGALLVNTTSTFSNCTIEYNWIGASIHSSSNITVLNSIIHFNIFGINVYRSYNNKFLYCQFSSNDVGLNLNQSRGNTIAFCDVESNYIDGLVFTDSSSNLVYFNHISENGWGSVDMKYSCNENEICFNTIEKGTTGIILMYSSQNNQIHHNDIQYNQFAGCYIYETNNTIIGYNNIKENQGYDTFGIYIVRSDGCIVNRNNIFGNDVGVRVGSCYTDLKNNWWGSSDGPSGEGSGEGDIIYLYNATVSFNPFLKFRSRVWMHGFMFILFEVIKEFLGIN
jgi:parallel beta-helix repeat protein